MMRIESLEQLESARVLRKAVCCPKTTCFRKPCPAAWIINLPGHVLLRLLRSGMYLYVKEDK
jgi:hypothetical protein